MIDPDVVRLGQTLAATHLTEDLLLSVTPELVRLADRHWVAPLLAHRLAERDALARLPAGVAAELRHQLCFEGAFELAVGREIRDIVATCAREGVRTSLMKGAALAYTHYPAPNVRPRLDTDLLIHQRDLKTVRALMRGLGYQETPAVSGAATVQQTQFVKPTAGGLPHAVDVHWKIVNPVVFADLLGVDEIAQASVAVAAIGPDARALCPVHALLQLAIHRIAHHEPALNLLGLYDLHLVAAGLTPGEWTQVMALTDARGLAELIAIALTDVMAVYATPLPDAVRGWVRDAARRPWPEAYLPFTATGRRLVDVIASDFHASRGWARACVLRERLLPPPAYMRARYAIRWEWTLPYFYVRRMLSGVPRMLRRDLYR